MICLFFFFVFFGDAIDGAVVAGVLSVVGFLGVIAAGAADDSVVVVVCNCCCCCRGFVGVFAAAAGR